jgi:hypothetical protein
MILIAFRHSDPRPFARLVTCFRGGDSAHVEAALPLPVEGMHLCVSASFLDGGVRGKVIDISNPAKWRVYRWTGPHLDPLVWLQEHDKAQYDLRGLLGILAPRIGHSRSKRFCSEAVAEHIRLNYPDTYDLLRLERHVAERAPLVEWVGGQWVDMPAKIAA